MAICGGEELEGHDAGMARIGGSVPRNARREIPGRAVIVQGQRRVVEADVHVAAAAGPLRVEDRCHQRQRRHDAARVIGQGEPALDRWAARVAGERRPAGLRLDQRVVAGLGVPFAVASIGRQRDADDRRVDPPQQVVGETKVLEDVASQIGIDSVRVATQFVKDFLAGRALEVEQHAALASVEGIEIEAVRAALPGRDVAADIAAGRGILQPDDVGAEVGQVKGPERSGAELLDGDDPDARERSLLHAELLQAGPSAHTMAEVYRQRTWHSAGCDGRAKPKIASCLITPSGEQGLGTGCGTPASTCSSCLSRATSST